MDLLRFALLGLGAGSVYALAGQGIVLIYRGSGVLNFAHGALGMLGAFAFFGLRDAGLHVVFAGLITVALGAAMGLAIAQFVMRPLRAAPALSRLIATLALLTAILGFALTRWGTTPRIVSKVLPVGPVDLGGGLIIGRDRLVLLAIAVVLTFALRWVYGQTAFGLATTGTAENRQATAAQGVSPDLIAATNWALGGVLAVVSATLVVNLSGLQVLTLTLLVVPALAAALVGDFRSFPMTLAAGLLMGVLESELTYLQTKVGTSATLQGLSRAVPFVVIVTVLVVRGSALPLRSHRVERTPAVGTGRIPPLLVAGVASLAVAATLFLPPDRALVVTSTSATIVIALSLTVVTGYAGQLSIAQFALAGAGAWVCARAIADLGLPLELAVLVGIVGTVPVGLMVAVPALRSRGVNLAIATLALSLVIESLLLRNADLTGGLTGIQVGSPSLLGIDIDNVRHPARYAAVAVALVAVVGVAVANLRRSRAGRRLVAIKSNERAAAALGIDVVGGKLFAFGLAAAIAAIGGMLLALRRPTVVLSSFGFVDSIVLVVESVIGGVGFVLGAVIAGLISPTGLGVDLAGDVADPSVVQALLGIGVLVLLFRRPDGLASWRPPMLPRLQRQRPQRTPSPPDGSLSPIRPAGLSISGLTVDYGGVRAVQDATVEVEAGQILGLIGPNGAGKTSLLDAIAGEVTPSAGSVMLGDRVLDGLPPHRRARAGLGRSFQSVELFDMLTVRDNLRVAAEPRDRLAYLTGLVHPGDRELPDDVLRIVDLFDLQDDLDRHPTELSHGRRRIVALARAAVASPRCLLLDEPAAGLDDAASSELALVVRRLVAETGTTVVLVEHDLALVLAPSDQVVVMAEGRVLMRGTPEEVSSDPFVAEVYLGDETVIGPDRDDEPSRRASRPSVDSDVRAPGPRAGPVSVRVRGLDAGYGGVPVVRGLDLDVRPGEIVALLGPNGAGKTTSLLTIAGDLDALGGDVEVLGAPPHSLHLAARRGVALVPEERAIVPSLTTAANLRLGGDTAERATTIFPELRDLLERPAGLLSGGEQQMLCLGRALAREPQVLLVDELSLGLAPAVVERLLQHIVDAAASGVAVLMVEQQARRALTIADRGVVLRHGDMVLEGTAADLLADLGELQAAYLGGVPARE